MQQLLDSSPQDRIAEQRANGSRVALHQLEHQLVLNEELEPRPIRVAHELLDGPRAGAHRTQPPPDLLRALIDDGAEHRLLVREVVVERPGRQLRAADDVAYRGR